MGLHVIRDDGGGSLHVEGSVSHIFIADDSASDVFLVRRALDQQNFSHDLAVAQDGEEALAMLEQFEKNASPPPQIILLDLNLPKVAGDEILAYIRRTRAFDNTIVVIFTTSDSPQDRNLARTLGANVYFQKPTDLRSFMQLGQVIENLLRDAEGHS